MVVIELTSYNIVTCWFKKGASMSQSSKPLQSSSIAGKDSSDEKVPHSNRKHWVCAVTQERAMRKQAEHWVDLQVHVREKDYTSIKPNELSKVKAGDVLYLYCHSGYVDDSTSPYVGIALPYMISDFNKGSSKDIMYSPKDFLKFLQNCGLKNECTIVKITSCNSDIFANKAAIEARQQGIFPNMCISGYEGQLVLCQGEKNAKLAGLKEPYVIKDNKDHWIINEDEFAKGHKSKIDFQAKKHRKDFHIKAMLQNTQPATAPVSQIDNTSNLQRLATGNPLANSIVQQASIPSSLSPTQPTN
jgi:hypothetical protein